MRNQEVFCGEILPPEALGILVEGLRKAGLPED